MARRFLAGVLGLLGGCAIAIAAGAGNRADGTFRAAQLRAMDGAISNSISAGRLPGAVLWVGHGGGNHSRAYGNRAVVPVREPMTMETVFDAASLTKVIATAPAVMRLVEAGRLDLDAPASRYLPEFTGDRRETITLRQLLTHVSGLPPGLPRAEPWVGESRALALAASEPLADPPGTRFRYSDINFILLGMIVERVTGERLDAVCEREIFRPLGMNHTGFRPFSPSGPLDLPGVALAAADVAAIAPTEVLTNGFVLRGVVHDPTARRLGGVAGHAGLFTTAADLARFSQMFLNHGSLDGKQVLASSTVDLMTSVQSPSGLPRRGLGWDVDSPYAGQRGSVFPVGGYGHTGWTGTSLWIDPASGTYVLLLSNRNHPSEEGSVLSLRREIGTLAAQSLRDFTFASVRATPGVSINGPSPNAASTPAPQTGVNFNALNGIDALVRNDFVAVRGMKLGLVTNQTGRDREGRSSIDLLLEASGVKLVALFSPEHGIRGELDQEKIGDTIDAKSGLPVYSLYGERRAPTPEQLAGLDALMFDIQDIGCRFYTYISTMGLCMEAAAGAGKRFIVLDRVNPIGGMTEGPVASGERSFVAWHEIPLRHGMSVGELARMFNSERQFGADLTVIPVRDWTPAEWFDQTGLPWVNPSPNMRSLTAATLYPGVGLLEYCSVSVGRGTPTPFELLGAPYIDEGPLSEELNRSGLKGVRFEPVRFTPDASMFAARECRGVRLRLTDRSAFRAADLGIVLAASLHRRYPNSLQLERINGLLVNPAVLSAIRSGRSLAEIRSLWLPELEQFTDRRRPYLLYPR